MSRQGLCLVLSACLVTLPAVRAHADDPPPAPAEAPIAPPGPGAPPPPPPENTPSATGVTPTAPISDAPPAADPVAAPGLILTPTPTATVSAALPHTENVYKRPHGGLLGAGLAVFTVGYVSDIGFTYGYKHSPAYTSLIPFAGPFIQMTQKYGLDGSAVDTGNPDADARIAKNLDNASSTIRGLAISGAILSALFQVGGLALIIAGAVTKRKVTRYAGAAAGGAVFRF